MVNLCLQSVLYRQKVPDMADLLLELLSEEIPSRMQLKAAEDLKNLITNGLVEAGLTYSGAAAFSTPRRLVLTLQGLLDESPTQREERKGPRVDAPEKALEGFLRSTGLDREALEIRDDKKGQVYFANVQTPGRSAALIIGEVLEKILRTFPWPKSMRWGNGRLRWVRPLHTIICLLSDEVGTQIVPFEIDGIKASDQTFGHRFMAPNPFSVTSFDDYAAKLKRNYVILDPVERSKIILQEVENQAFACGHELVSDLSLLAEVSGLVEWPVVLMGSIEPEFLDLPPEVLRLSMKEHQKFFSLRHLKTGRIERFITVANRETADQGVTILKGNQKVLSARLSDAKFFWENDLRLVKAGGMATWVARLADVTFHNKLGSEAARIERLTSLSQALAPYTDADPALAKEAALVVKADLASEMVYEFPALQGVMGRYYSIASGLADEIAQACELHYAPLGPSDAVPDAPVSIAVALADKIDKLTAFWAIGEKPTGSKDPFALRRAALGVIRLILENELALPLLTAFSEANPNADAENLLCFFHDRLKVFLRGENIRHDFIDAAIVMKDSDDLMLVTRRARALDAFLQTADGENLLQGFKRANNIVTQAEQNDGVEYSYGADIKFAETDEERDLFLALETNEPAIKRAIKVQDFNLAMESLASLRPSVDGFFEAVQVNADKQIVRRNRLNILSRMRSVCLEIADFSQIEG